MSGPIIVQKYGGTCLATPDKLRAVAKMVADRQARGERMVVVVSAMGKTTDELIRLAYSVSPQPNRRELDMLLSTGERVAMSLMSMALSDLGVSAISFTGSQAGVLTNESHSGARIVDVRPLRVSEALSQNKVVVLAGFQGVNPVNKEITTLGRGGSDTTAVAMAAALKATRCEIIKEVDGVCTADPRLVKGAKALRRLDFASLGEMCFWGAKVLHYRSVELARSTQTPLAIRMWGSEDESTVVSDEVKDMEIGKVLAVNSHARVEHLSLACTDLNDGFERMRVALQTHSLPWPQILAATHEQGQARWMLTSDAESLDTLLRSLKGTFQVARPTLSSVSLTCFGAVASDLPAKAMALLAKSGIRAEKYLLSPNSVTFLVDPGVREKAVSTLHALT